MDDRLFHGQPLRERVLPCDHDIDVVTASQAVIEDREKAIGVRRQIDAHDIGLLIGDMIQKSRILVGEAIVILLPDMRRQEVVQGGDLAPPRQLERDLEPFRMLAEHRIDDANKGLIAVEDAVASRQQISFQPTFALMFAELRIHDAAVGERIRRRSTCWRPIAYL